MVMFSHLAVLAVVAASTWQPQNSPAACVEIQSMLIDSGGRLNAPLSYTAALQAADQCVASRGNHDDYILRGYVHEGMRQYELAESDYSNAVRLHPGAASHYSRGVNRRLLGRYVDSIADIREAMRLGFVNPAQAHVEIAISLRALGKFDDALSETVAALTLQPSNRSAYIEQRHIYAEQERWDEVVGVATRLIAADPSSAEAYNYRGQGLLELGRLDAALSDFDRAVSLNNRFPDANSNRGSLLMDMGRFREAVEAYERAISFDGSNRIYWANLCLAQSHADEQRRALSACDRAYELSETNVQRATVLSIRGLISERLGQSGSAEAYYRDSLRLGAEGRSLTRVQDGLRRLGVS